MGGVKCPKCNILMHEVYFGDNIQRWRCMRCEALFSAIEWQESDGEIVKIGRWRGLRKRKEEINDTAGVV